MLESSMKHRNILTPRVCERVSINIGTDWRRFGHHLDLDVAELDIIDSDFRKTYDKAMKVLQIWKQKTGNETWEQLKVHLISFQRYYLIREVEKELSVTSTVQQGCFFR